MVSDRRETIRLIREDAAKDAASLDGQEMSGYVVGTMFGNLLASIDALAALVDSLIPEDRSVEEVAIDYTGRNPA